MKKTRWICITVGALLVLVLTFVAGAYFGARTALLKCLRQQVRVFGPDHDAFVLLAKFGSKEDIPFFFYGLKQQTKMGGDEACAYGHCAEGLRKLSGANPGETYADWTNWWVREMKAPVPEWHPAFYPVAWKKFVQENGPTNGGRPVRSETNGTPAAGGSPR